MRRALQDHAFRRITRNEGGPRLPAFFDEFGSLQIEFRLGGGFVVARDAVGLEEGVDVFEKIEVRR